MKNKLYLCCLVPLLVGFGLEVFAVSYAVDPQECIANLKWNAHFTQATCKIRKGPTATTEGASAVNFVLPVDTDQPQVRGFIRPLSNGYVMTLKAEAPVSPEEIIPILTWALGVIAPEGILAPEGLCAKLLSEVKAVL